MDSCGPFREDISLPADERFTLVEAYPRRGWLSIDPGSVYPLIV